MSRRNTIAALLERVAIQPDGCWLWTGTKTRRGYGQVSWNGRGAHVHRLFYESHAGPVPDGLTLDHLCRNRACVNPSHLEPVTNRENILRGVVPSANRTVCKAGEHDITTPGAIYVDSEGYERCAECRAASKRRYAERQKAAA